MNTRMIGFLLGRILMVEAGLLALPLLTALLYGEPLMPWLATMLVLAAIGWGLSLRKPERTALYAKDGFAAVALVWLLMSAFGALPFVLSGDIPNYIDAFFETVSGFTTTGASILTAVEPLSRGGLLWRSFTHWVGGMGVLVFVMAILPMSDGHTMHILRAEMPGPTAGKLVSRMSDTAKILYGMYFVMTLVMIGLLLLGGMDLFDASVHAFGAAGTGGFSSRNASVGAYNSAYIDIVTGIGMLAFGINFNLYYFLLMRRFRDVAKSEELWAYLGIVAFSTVTIAANICHLYGAVGTSLRHAFFQVSSIITTTGYATVDFDQWPSLSRYVMLFLMMIGACAGSTGGGIKVSRLLIAGKTVVKELRSYIHPKIITKVKMDGKPIEHEVVRATNVYVMTFVVIFTASVFALSFEGHDLVTNFTAVAATINNIGPGLSLVGPAANFNFFSPISKYVLMFDMLAGRLELFPLLILFHPTIWRELFAHKAQERRAARERRKERKQR